MRRFSEVAAVGAFAAVVASALVGAPSADADVLQSCPSRDGLSIAINSGDIDCASAYYYAGRYDQYGDKYQTIEPFTCYFGSAFTAPMLFTCVSEEPAAQFSVFPG